MNFAERRLEEALMRDYETPYVRKAPQNLYLKDINERKGYNYDDEYINCGFGHRRSIHNFDCLPYIRRVNCNH